ncbi:DUF5681 domain-containing protein [Acuticoccus sp.]|uniref:DUF5681 domain-containing protein n=1 Tax=Acuticoccus sp. TaxID=1904378 RepID=UPI003B51F7F0
MSEQRDVKLPAVRSSAEYAVGYGKPPVHSRFKPGQSGNPKGRAKGSKNRPLAVGHERLQSIILEEAYRDVTVHDGTRDVTVPMAQAVVRSLAANAAKGRQGAQKLFAELLAATERQRRAEHADWIKTWVHYKKRWEEELARREALGIDASDPLPYPDHVVVDLRADTATIVGPVTKEEKAKYDRWIKRRELLHNEAEELRDVIMRVRNKTWKAAHAEDLAHTEKAIEVLDKLLSEGGWWFCRTETSSPTPPRCRP